MARVSQRVTTRKSRVHKDRKPRKLAVRKGSNFVRVGTRASK